MKKTLAITAVAVLVVAAAVGITGYVQFKGSAVDEERELFLSKRLTYSAVLDSLMPSINHHTAFGYYARHIDLERSFKPGHYVLKPGMNVMEVARMLKLGIETPVKVSFQYAKIPPHLAGKLAPQIDADSAELVKAFTDKNLAKEFGLDSVTLFSIFLPNTYEVYWTITPEQFVRRMKQENDRFWTEGRKEKLRRTGLTRLEAMTLASIVFEETRAVDEMARIAGVYMNRLRIGMPLQADPTVKFALQDFGLRRILNKHLKTPSPYNTYLNRGLPPSPICLAGIPAIDAVLNYEHHAYLYFCARPTFDGHHNFARTYSEHLKNARAYVRELNRRKIK